MIERPSRRPALAVYVANIASETIFRIFSARGYFKPIKSGEILLFTITMSTLLYLIKKNGYGSDPVSLALKFIIGREEAKRKVQNSSQAIVCKPQNLSIASNQKESPKATNFLFKLIEKINSIFPKHESCPHKQKSCLTYVSLALVQSFCLGWFGKCGLQTLSKAKLMFLRPHLIGATFLDPKNIKFGLFLAAFTSVYKGVNCGLRWASNQSHDWHAFIAALLAGPTMLISPNTPITLYLMWKCIEV